MVAYAELHTHSNFSFLDGASHPEALITEAARLELNAIALTDHDGLYGVVRFAEAARRHNMATVFGAELSIGLTKKQNGIADPQGEHLVVLARSPVGYGALSTAIADAQLAGAKGKPQFSIQHLGDLAKGNWLVLTGCRKGSVPAALVRDGPRAAGRALDELISLFGRPNVAVELFSHDDPLDSARNDALAALAVSRSVDLVATSNAHYARPTDHHLAAALAAIRSRRSLDEIDGWLPSGPSAHLRSGAEQARRFAKYPGVVEHTAELGQELSFDLHLVAPGLPPFPVPPGHNEMSYLRHLVDVGATKHYGPRSSPRVVGAWERIEHELAVIESLGFPGYFLIVWDIVMFCRRNGIYCQGRGSAANSAVCYAIGVTAADAVSLGLVFERFLSSARDGPPDIDVDIESGRREEAIQYVYERHGRHHTAQVANLITYRQRSALRDAGKALGYPDGAIDAWSKAVGPRGRFEDVAATEDRREGEVCAPDPVLRLARRLEHFPRHLGVHSGGMVICDRPIVEVCPVEWATAPGRTVLQWDKQDCAAVGLVKFDLLGLGMLEALHRTIDLLAEHDLATVDLSHLPQDPAVYEMLCQADTVGVFQVESRAQMNTLPRLRPQTFYDLVIEIALIRPGPIQGGSVHPYLRRRNKEEEVTYLHPLLEPCLKKTLGVPLFQEQLMQMAIDVAGFTAAEADQLRQAMSSKRSKEAMGALKDRFYAGMARRGITGNIADEIFSKMAAFANFGFPESHSISFAYLVYSSAWLKLHYPAAFLAGLLNAQPMGFWSPRTLIADARRHGVVVDRADVNVSGVDASLEVSSSDGVPVVRLGLAAMRGIGTTAAQRIVDGQPYRSLEDFVRRSALSQAQLETLATAGATNSFGGDRRDTLWAVGALSQSGPQQLEGIVVGVEAPPLPAMTDAEHLAADIYATGVSVDASLTELVREELKAAGVVTAAELRLATPGSRVRVAGIVTHRQRPETARGITFLSLEDETGLVNVICSVGLWKRYRTVAQSAPAMVIRGLVESNGGVFNVVADRLEFLELAVKTRSRDFS